MPTIYRIEDSQEVTRARLDNSIVAAVTTDGKKTGILIPESYQALLVDEQIKPLLHPLERSAIRRHKETFLSASLKGRLLHVEKRICLQDGQVFDAPRITFGATAGCLPGVVIGLAVFSIFRLGLAIGTSSSMGWAWLSLMLVFLCIQAAGTLYIRLRFPERQARIAQPNCPICAGNNTISVRSAAGKRLQVGSSDRWLQVSIAGKS